MTRYPEVYICAYKSIEASLLSVIYWPEITLTEQFFFVIILYEYVDIFPQIYLEDIQ